MSLKNYSLLVLLAAILAACAGSVQVVIPVTTTPARIVRLVTATPAPALEPTPTPVSAPKLLGREPWGYVSNRRPLISLTFDRAMDQGSVAAAFRIEPPAAYDLRWEGDTVYADLREPLTPEKYYQFFVDQTAADTAGNSLSYPVDWVITISRVLERVSGPTFKQKTLQLFFNYAMSAGSVEAAAAFDPPLSGKWTWNAGNTQATFTLDDSYAPDTVYTLRFNGELRDLQGDPFPPPAPQTFQTPTAILTPATSLSPLSPVRTPFDRPMDRVAVEAAFSLKPATRGSFTWDENTLVFTPEQGYLEADADYTLTIARTAKAADGAIILKSDWTHRFRTEAFEPIASFGLGPNAQVLDAAGRRAIQFTTDRNDVTLTAELYRLSRPQFLSRYETGFVSREWHWERQEYKPSLKTDGLVLAKRWQKDLAGALKADGYDYYYGGGRYQDELIVPADTPPGAYLLNLTSGMVNDQLFLIITRQVAAVKKSDAGIMAWVTDFNGGPQPDRKVEVFTRDGKRILAGQTDADGLFRAELKPGDQPAILIAYEGDTFTVAGLSGEWGGRASAAAPRYAAYIYTDRPIYRPGQTVHYKAILRRDADAVLSVLSEGAPVTARIRDSRNNVVQTFQLASNGYGTVNGEFTLAEGAMLGKYAVEISVDGESYRQDFKVQDYRKPDYAVTLTTNALAFVEGETIRGSIETAYFFGKPAVDAPVTVKYYELQRDYYYCDEVDCRTAKDVWVSSYYLDAVTGKTDRQGRFTFATPAKLDRYSDWGYWQSGARRSQLGIEVTVDDGSHQTVSAFTVVKIYDVGELLRLDTGGYLQTPGQPFTVRANVSSIADQPVAGRALKLELKHWRSGDYVVAQTLDLTTDANGAAAAALTAPDPGYYYLTVSGRDKYGHEFKRQRELYIFGNGDPWAAPSDLKLTAERDSYQPGETAALLVQSPFSGPALLTFERGTVRREQRVQLTAPLTRLNVPIQPDDAPNIFITVQAWQKQETKLEVVTRDYNSGDYWWGRKDFSQPDSRLLVASVDLSVPANEKLLTVVITPDKDSYMPREAATFTVRVANWKGEGVAAEVSLALVDEAIFTLSDDLSGPLFDTFYARRANGVSSYNSMAVRRWLYFPCECGGGGGGGGGGDFGAANPRSNFPDTAWWAPALYTDWKGEATVTLTLPDNLTSWRVLAKAATADTQLGETQINVVTRQPIIVRPLLPRTLTAGDEIDLSALVHNYTESQQQLAVTIDPGDLIQLRDPASQTITLAAGAQTVVGWTAAAVKAGEASLTFSVNPSPNGGGVGVGEGDSVRLLLTIQPLAVPEVTTQVGDFKGEFTTILTAPEGASDLSTVRVELNRSIAGSLLTGLEYLTGFPYGCVEQTMSKALPNAVVGRALHQLGVGDSGLSTSLPPKINAGIQRLYGFQHDDGGWGWWHADDTDAYQTAWVIFGLSVTAEAGYEVDSGVIRRGADWLTAHLNEMDERTRAFALYSLAAAGQGDLPATRLLAKKAESLDAFSQAALALALHKLGAAADARQMLALLEKTAKVENGWAYWPTGNEDGHYYAKTMASTTRSTALALTAFVRLNPTHPYEAQIVRYLMSQRKGEGWGSTNETSFTILALTDHLLAKESGTAETNYTVQLNGQALAEGTLGKGQPTAAVEIPISRLRAGDNSLRLTQSGGGQLYYIINSRMIMPQVSVTAAGNVAVERVYVDEETGKQITGPVAAGQLVAVQLTVTLPGDGFYMLVEDKLPAGLEALDEGLNTSSHEGQGYNDYYTDDVPSWRRYGYNYKEVRGDRVSFFITELSGGMHTFTYYARATRAGQFVALPAEVWAMYDLAVWGRSASSELVVSEVR